MKQKKNTATIITYIALIIGSLIMVFPFVWMVLTAFKTNAEVMQVPPKILPSAWNMSSFTKALDLLPFTNLYINTALTILLRVICAVVFCSMAGYAFAKLNFKGKNALFTLIIVQQMIPGQIFIIPQYQMIEHPDWAYTIPGRDPVLGRNQLVLDFSRKEVVDYIFKMISQVIDSARVEYLKMDMNHLVSDREKDEIRRQIAGNIGT